MAAELFGAVVEKGNYKIGYIDDGWTREFFCEASSPGEAMMITQNMIGNICNVTCVEMC